MVSGEFWGELRVWRLVETQGEGETINPTRHCVSCGVNRMEPLQGSFSFGCGEGDGLKGRTSGSPGQRPGWSAAMVLALQGQNRLLYNAFAPAGRGVWGHFPQGVALGWLINGLTGRHGS